MSFMKWIQPKPKKGLDHNGRILMVFEGEQINPGHVPLPTDLVIPMDNQWRPEGQPIHEHLEPIPGYERPVNWKALQARTEDDLRRKVTR